MLSPRVSRANSSHKSSKTKAVTMGEQFKAKNVQPAVIWSKTVGTEELKINLTPNAYRNEEHIN